MGGVQELFQAIPKGVVKEFLLKAFPILNREETTAVGLDWNGSEIRVVEVLRGAARPKIIHCYAGTFEDPPEIAVKKGLALANIISTSVRVAVEGEGVIVRYLKLPPMKKEEIPTALSFELEKYIPYKESEVALDYQIVGETQDKKIRLLIVAAKRNLIQSLIDSYQQAELHPILIDAAGFAVCNAFFFNQIHKNANEAVGVIHVNKGLTMVNVLKQNTGYFSRDISMGESQIQSDTALLVDLANEVRYSFDYYESQWNDSVKKVYVSGRLAPGLMDSFQKALGLETSFWDPTLAFEIGEEIRREDFEKMKPHLHLALGLAIRTL